MPELPQVGDEFAGYRLRSVLGRGGMSVVYAAESPRLGDVIALKVLAPELAANDAFGARFLKESPIAAALNHPHVIPIHDTGSSDGLLYIAMRRVCGTDLRQMIKERGKLQPDAAIFLLSQAASALDAAHGRGLVHRDVKPGNLLVERDSDDSDPGHLYLAGFGITRTVLADIGPADGGSQPATGRFPGPVEYVAPEQIRGGSVLGPADQYSLGCVLYECLTGRAPFEKDRTEAITWAQVDEQPIRPTMLCPDLPDEVDAVFTQALARQPGDRFENCREFIAATRGALGLLAASRSADRSPRPGRPAGYRPAGYREVAHDRGGGVRAMAASGLRSEPRPPTSILALSAPVPGQYPDEAPYQERAPAYDDREVPGGPGGPGGPDGRTASGRPGRDRGNLRVPLLVLAGAVLIAVGAGIGTAIGLSRQNAAVPGPSRPAAAALSAPTPSLSAAAPAPAPRSASEAPVSALETALVPVQNFTGKLNLAHCKFPSATFVTCTAPDPKGAIASATFQTFPSLSALYTAYQAEVAAMAGKPFGKVENTQNCGSPAPQPMGEISWNHSDQHTLKYSVAQLASGQVPQDIAAGRMFCLQLPGGGENIVWTQNYGDLLVVAHGAVSHEQVWLWFVAVHHNVAFGGQPAMSGMPGMSMPGG